MATIDRSERLLNLVSFLLKSARPVGLAQIRESVIGYQDGEEAESSAERRFQRDKIALRDLGVPLDYVFDEETETEGYVIPREAYFLPEIQLHSREAALLASAARLAMTGAVGPMSDALQSALRKLQFDSANPGSIHHTDEEHFIFHQARPKCESREQKNLRDLASAVLGRYVMQFSYYAMGTNAVSRRVVEPYGIGFSQGHWYLVGFDRARKDIRLFRTDRIRGRLKRPQRGTTPEFDVPEDFRVEDYVGMPPWLFGKTTRTKVRIKLDADVAFMARMHPSPGDQWTRTSDGMVLTRQATQLDSLLRWVLGFGHHAEVLEPPEFRKRVMDTLQAVARTHRQKSVKGAKA